MRTLADVIAFNEAHAAEEMPYFGQKMLIKAEADGLLAEAAIEQRATRQRACLREGALTRRSPGVVSTPSWDGA